MVKEFTGWGFAVGDVRGTRAWVADRDGQLYGVTHAQAWTPGENHAKCLRVRPTASWTCACGCGQRVAANDGRMVSDPCAGMEPSCGCGFYAYLHGHNDYLIEYSGPPNSMVGGVIRGWGKTVVGPRGFRTEKAEILALYVPSDGYLYFGTRLGRNGQRLLGTLEANYGVPAFSDWRELLDQYPPTEPEVTEPRPAEAET